LNELLNKDINVDMAETNGWLSDILDELAAFHSDFNKLFDDPGDQMSQGDDIIGKAQELVDSVQDLQDFASSVDASALQSLKDRIPQDIGVTPHSWSFSFQFFDHGVTVDMPNIPNANVFRTLISGMLVGLTITYGTMIIIRNVKEL
jgi:hypothetical protein